MFSKLYFVVLPFVLIFVYFYVTLVNTSFGKQLNELSLKYFSKSFFSGRSELWEAIWQVGLKQPIFGHGIGLQPKEVTEFTLSSHNQYLQVFLETGFLGLIAFCILLFFIWKALLKNSHTYVGAWSACFFIGILFYQSMEYSLFINNLSLSYLQWLIITIGISFNER
ncbi:O-antigen ligase family protein [Piscibacillus salipiscarius]|nr:O-antigen ligase family protein [Piscibacillus salipiscarius]